MPPVKVKDTIIVCFILQFVLPSYPVALTLYLSVQGTLWSSCSPQRYWSVFADTATVPKYFYGFQNISSQDLT